jgi:sulfite dehydrogenase (quinone) subunit SoeC
MPRIDPHAEARRAATMTMGCGLLALTGMFSASGLLPADRWFGLAALGVAFVALAHGAATLRQSGEPAASWTKRWRLTLAATTTAGLLFAIGWVGFDTRDGLWRWFGLFAASFSAMAIYCAAMVHAGRVNFPDWANRWSTPSLLTLALLTGGLWLNAISHVFDAPNPDIAMLVVVALFLAFYVKRRYWRLLDLVTGKAPSADNARHRRTAFLCLFVAPLLLTLIGMGRAPPVAFSFTALAALSALGGLVVERWLFTAEGENAQFQRTPPEIAESD